MSAAPDMISGGGDGSLTPRMVDVLALILQDLGESRIAAELGVSQPRVTELKHAIYARWKVGGLVGIHVEACRRHYCKAPRPRKKAPVTIDDL